MWGSNKFDGLHFVINQHSVTMHATWTIINLHHHIQVTGHVNCCKSISPLGYATFELPTITDSRGRRNDRAHHCLVNCGKHTGCYRHHGIQEGAGQTVCSLVFFASRMKLKLVDPQMSSRQIFLGFVLIFFLACCRMKTFVPARFL